MSGSGSGSGIGIDNDNACGGTCVLCEESSTIGRGNLMCSYCQLRVLKILADVEDIKVKIEKMQVNSLDESNVRIICNQQIRKYLGCIDVNK